MRLVAVKWNPWDASYGIAADVDDRGIELAEAAIYELRNRRHQGFRTGPLSPEEIDQALAALSAVRTLTKKEER